MKIRVIQDLTRMNQIEKNKINKYEWHKTIQTGQHCNDIEKLKTSVRWILQEAIVYRTSIKIQHSYHSKVSMNIGHHGVDPLAYIMT